MFNVNKNSLCNIEKVIADGGYTGLKFSNEVNKILGAEVEVIKRSELHSFKVLPKRWIVERSFAWIEKNRRLWKNYERTLNSAFI